MLFVWNLKNTVIWLYCCMITYMERECVYNVIQTIYWMWWSVTSSKEPVKSCHVGCHKLGMGRLRTGHPSWLNQRNKRSECLTLVCVIFQGPGSQERKYWSPLSWTRFTWISTLKSWTVNFVSSKGEMERKGVGGWKVHISQLLIPRKLPFLLAQVRMLTCKSKESAVQRRSWCPQK
jgi:hypothetical protein